MSEEEDPDCIHGLLKTTCAICKRGPRKPSMTVAIMATFTARYDGQCPGCNLPIHSGIDVIHKLSNETYVHDGCEP